MKLKNIFIYSLLALVLPFFAACSEDNDDNPTFKNPTTFVLNTPALAANNVYDLQNASSIELTCSQPDYGYPAWTNYSVEVSLTQDFADYVTLSTTYNGAKIPVVAEEINDAVKSLTATWTEFPTTPVSLYVRVKASLQNSGGITDEGSITSNVICLPKVLAYSEAAALTLPKALYLTGSMPAGDGWGTWVKLNPIYSTDGKYYAVVYFDAGSEFKISQTDGWNGTDFGFNGTGVTITETKAANVSAASDEDGANFVVGNAGWYVLVVTCEINGKLYNYNVEFREPVVQLFGAGAGDLWAWDDSWKLTPPADGTSDWVSPVTAGAGEMRLAVDCGTDWWKTEFTFYNGSLYYRNVDIPSNWSEDVGSDYSVTLSAGQTIHVNFTTQTGSVE